MKKNPKALIIGIIAAVIVVVGIIVAVVLINNNKKDPLIGSWANGSYVYTFNEDGTCSYAYSNLGAMECTYETNGENISILYTGSTAPFESTYRIEDNKLIVADSFGNDTVYDKK